MNPRLCTVLSVLVNLALAGYWLHLGRPAAAVTGSGPAPRRVVRTAEPASLPDPAAPAPPTAPASEASPGFHWSQIAALEWDAMRARLRQVGCPEATIRDVLRSEIDAHFAGRRRALHAPLQAQFWDLLARRGARLDEAIDPLTEKELEALRAARREALAKYAGAEPDDLPRRQQEQRAERAAHWGWLPAERREPMVALEARYDEARRQLEAEWERRGDVPAEERRRALQAHRDALERERTALLTPDEQAERHLRESSASGWAQRLANFDPTEQEWRSVAALQREFEDTVQGLPQTPRDQAEVRRQQARQAFQAEVEAALGKARYAEYQRAGDDAYQRLARVTQRLDLAEDVAREAYAFQQAALTQVERVRRHPALADDARAGALAALQRETESAFRAVLGERGFTLYQNHGGAWIAELTALPKRP